MKERKVKTYYDVRMEDKKFREKVEEEYQNLCISEQIAQARHAARLTQAALAKRIHTTKSAVSRYENADYKGYSMPLLNRIAKACNATLKVQMVSSK